MPGTPIEKAWPKYPGYVIDAIPLAATGRVTSGDIVVAESDRCLLVKESDHVDRLYFPLDDIALEHFTATDHHTICPFKGEASYWTLGSGPDALDNVLWSYPDPFEEVAAIAGHASFYDDRVQVTVTEHWSDDPRDDVTKRFPFWGSADDLLGLMDARPAGDNHFVAPTYPDPPYGTFFESARKLTTRNVIEGGQLLGTVISAASKTVPDKKVTSAYAVFVKAASFDEPLDIDVEVLRNGRTIAVVEVRVNQRGSLRCSAMVMLDAGADDLLRAAAPMPEVDGPYDSPALDFGVIGRDFREVDGSYRLRSDEVGPPEVNVWGRFRNPPTERYQHQALLAQATTHWTIAAAMRPQEGLSEADAHRTVSTGPLSIAIAFHDDFDATDWMLYANPAIYSGHGSSQGEGRVYARDGRLLASYSLQAMIRGFAAPAEGLGGYQTAM